MTDPRIHPMLLEAIELLSTQLPSEVIDLLRRGETGGGGLVHEEWRTLKRLRLAEDGRREDGAHTTRFTPLGECIVARLHETAWKKAVGG